MLKRLYAGNNGSNRNVDCVNGPPIVFGSAGGEGGPCSGTTPIPGARSSIWVYREPTCWKVPVRKPCAPARNGHRQVADAAPWTRGTLGSRLPSCIPEITLTFPNVSVEVNVDR